MFSREELESFNLKQLRLIDIKEVEDEQLVQELINKRMEESGQVGDIYRGDMPEITTPEQEAEYQAILDARKAEQTALRTQGVGNQPDTEEESEPAQPSAPVEDSTDEKLVDHELTVEDLEENPELVEQGLKVGDVVQIPAVDEEPKIASNFDAEIKEAEKPVKATKAKETKKAKK